MVVCPQCFSNPVKPLSECTIVCGRDGLSIGQNKPGKCNMHPAELILNMPLVRLLVNLFKVFRIFSPPFLPCLKRQTVPTLKSKGPLPPSNQDNGPTLNEDPVGLSVIANEQNNANPANTNQQDQSTSAATTEQVEGTLLSLIKHQIEPLQPILPSPTPRPIMTILG